jgi:hypothetical protein
VFLGDFVVQAPFKTQITLDDSTLASSVNQ